MAANAEHLRFSKRHKSQPEALFQQHIAAWQVRTPSQEEVESTLEGYAELAQNPLRVH